jgi:serine/threonine-protein kinase
MGTPDYMPPEQARGDRVDARADIYAVGAILYRALTGRKPFSGGDPMATLTAVLTEEPPRPSSLEPSIPLPLELIIQHAMSKKPSDRYASMDELDHELEAFDDPEAISQAVPISVIAATPADAMARTLLTNPTPPARAASSPTLSRAASSQTMAATARNVRLARPGLVFFTGLGLFWIYVNAMVAAASIIRLVRGTDLTQSEVTLALIGVSAALVTPFVLWVRHLKREVWPNTPRAIEIVSRMRRTVLYSATSYGLAAALVQTFEGIVVRNGSGVSRPGWAIFAFEVSLVVAAITWITTRKKKGT